MKKSTFFTTFPVMLLGIVMSLCLVAMPASAQTPVESLFELDGNAIDQSNIGDPDAVMPPDDWGQGDDTGSSDYVAGLSVNGGTPGGLAHLSSFVNDPNGDTGLDDIFIGGGSKDDLPIKEGVEKANGWAWTIGTAPDKDDLLGVGAAAYIPVLGELLIYDFGSLYAANGTSSIGNWFFKKDIGPCIGGPHDGKFGVVDGNDESRPCLDEQPEGPLHSIGDILIISENSNGGTVTNISVYKWVAGEYDECEGMNEDWSFVPPKDNLCLIGEYAGATCDNNPIPNEDPPEISQYVCGRMNQVSSESPDSYGYKSKFPPDDAAAFPAGTDGIDEFDYPAYTLLESGINISEILGNTECFSSFMKNTRTSAKPRSQLKDFAGGAFELCGIEVTKDCEAELNTAGDQVDVVFDGDVTNTGVVDLEIILADSEDGSEITKVCYDTNGASGECDSGDDVPADLVFEDGGAAFTLDAGRTVLYEGDYAFNGQLTSIYFTDTIMAIASLGENEVDTAEDDATCEIDPDPDIAVTKICSPAFVNGDTFEADIYGGATNTGNVTLVNVGLSDTKFSAAELTIVYDSNENGLVDSGEQSFVNGTDSLAVDQKLAYKAKFVSTSETFHENTMTASGINFFDVNDERTAEAYISCDISPDPNLKITKDCDTSINGTGVRLVQLGGVVSVEVGNIITVENTGNEVLGNVDVSDSEMLLSMSAPKADWDCTAGVCSGPLGLLDSVTFTQTYYPDGDNIIGALLDPGSVFFKNTATAVGIGVLSELPAGPKSDFTECKICPPCPTCN